jgi:hypothetical protein
LALGETDQLTPNEVADLKALLGHEAVIETKEGNRILLSKLIEQQRNNPFQRTGLELQVNDVDGTGRTVLYVISSLAGEDLLRLKTLHIAAVLARDIDGLNSFVPAALIAKGVSIGHISLQKILLLLPKAAEFVNQMAVVSGSSRVGLVLKGVSSALNGVVAVQNIGVKVGSLVGTKVSNVVAAINSNKYVKNGTVAGVLTFVAASAQITIGVIEYRHAEDEDLKHKIYVNTLSRTGATLAYALPYVGWAAAVLDLSHAYLGVPIETADIFRGVSWLGEAIAYKSMGLTHTKAALMDLESLLNLPRADVHLRLAAFCENTVESCENALVNIREEMQKNSLNQLVLLYVAHRTFAVKTNYQFGERMEDYIRSFQHNRRMMQKLESDIFNKLEDLN